MPLTRRATLVAMAGGVSGLMGCGGGGTGVAGLSSGGTGSFTSGTVKGLGSIIVNAVRYDDSTALIERSDGAPVGVLRPGMVVSVSASSIAPATSANQLPSATATRITYASEWIGKVEAVDLTNQSIIVFGKTLVVPVSAVIEGDARSFSALKAQQYVEIHGYLDTATGSLLVTRLDVSSQAPANLALSGRVSALDTSARTFMLGSTSISYATLAALPAGLANGVVVRVSIAAVQVSASWSATDIQPRQSVLTQLKVQDQVESEVEGTVTSVDGASAITVNGSISVDLSHAQVVGVPAVGAGIEVRGVVVNATLAASRAEVKTDEQLELNEFDFIGTLSGLDLASQSFHLQNILFTYTASTLNEVAGWSTGSTPSVRVKASLLGGNWVASEIRPQS